jgi:hypothetical protein
MPRPGARRDGGSTGSDSCRVKIVEMCPVNGVVAVSSS